MQNLELRAALPSGRSESVVLPSTSTVGDLRKAVQQSLGRPFLRLAAPDGRLLDDPTESLEVTGVQEGDAIAVVTQQPKIAATRRAFALWCEGYDRVVAWGDANYGGDSSAVRDQRPAVPRCAMTFDQQAAEQLARDAAEAMQEALRCGDHRRWTKQGRENLGQKHRLNLWG
eukprot:Skav205295  [mRNA]  locus=scaffold1587:128270:133992:- [translate_table: standard]